MALRDTAHKALSRLDAWVTRSSTYATAPTRPQGNLSHGWRNPLSGLGFAATDKGAATDFGKPVTLSERQCVDLYEGDGMARRVIDAPILEAFRRPWHLENGGDKDSDAYDRLSDLRVSSTESGASLLVKRWLTWGRMFGGSVVVFLTDSDDTNTPMGDGEILRECRVLSRHEIERANHHLTLDPLADNSDDLWRVTGTARLFHRSRLHFYGLSTLPLHLRRADGWDLSVYSVLWSALQANGTLDTLVPSLLHQYVTPVQKIKGLERLLSEHGSAVLERMGLQQLMRSSYRTTVIGEGEEYRLEQMPLTGLPELMDKFPERVSAVTGIPLTVLQGRSPGGLNATGESDLTIWYAQVAAVEQETYARPLLEKIAALDGRAHGGAEPRVVFAPLWQPTEAEMEAVKKTRAERDAIYVQAGVLSPQEVAASRFGPEDDQQDPGRGDVGLDEAARAEAKSTSLDPLAVIQQTRLALDALHTEAFGAQIAKGLGWDPATPQQMAAYWTMVRGADSPAEPAG